MKARLFYLLLPLVMVALPSASYALGIEAAIGGWAQDPSGDIAYKGEGLDIDDDLKYDDETRLYGRVKIDLPTPVPNIYLMATPMSFEGRGEKDATFRFGDETFQADVKFISKLDLDHYDLALYYGLPFIKTATADVLNVELGLNVRVIDFNAEITQSETGIEESKSYTLPVPMVYLGVQVAPVEWLAIEAEGRGVAYSGNHYYDGIGRLKVKPLGPVFIAGGWRFENISLDEKDIEADIDVDGPFAEVGVEF
jgi:outer membrane protein